MSRSSSRILTTHTGSLIRTPGVLEVMRARVLGDPLDEDQAEAAIAEGIADAVGRQVEAGVDIPNDGEYGRRGFNNYIEERIGGVEPVELDTAEENPFDTFDGPKSEWERFPGFSAQYNGSVKFAWRPPEVDMTRVSEVRGKKGVSRRVFRLVEPISYIDTAVQRDIANLRAALDGHDVAGAFITAATPAIDRQDMNVLEFYPSIEAYRYAMADVMREEYKAITDAGFILQIDRQYPNDHGDSDDEIAAALEASIEIENYALRDIPEKLTRLHWCAGSGNRPHIENIPMAKVIKSMLKMNVGAYGFEAANPRHEHEWRIWEDVKLPEGKVLVPGVISQSTNVVEHPELVAWRIKNFVNLVGPERVIAGVDCGFSQSWDLPRTHAEVQWAKLRALAEGAAIASA